MNVFAIKLKRGIALALALALALGVFGGGASATELIPRTPLASESVSVARLSASSYYATVKFSDAGRVRIAGGSVVTAAPGTSTAAITSVLAEHNLLLKPEIQLSPALIETILAEAETRSGRAQPDLQGIYYIVFPTTSSGDRQSAINDLLALASVEYLSIKAVNVPPPTATPNLHSFQTYFLPPPGINATFAESVGLRGEGMKYVDIERCWLPDHEDQQSASLLAEEGPTQFTEANIASVSPDLVGSCRHGAASVGILSSSAQNAFGMKGMARAAVPYVFPELSTQSFAASPETFGNRRAAAILNASSIIGIGDVIMLEMQTLQSKKDPFSNVPAEYDHDVWLATKVATDRGQIVVAAAGNGGRELSGSD